MALALFDLDNTLIAGDSDHAWGQFLVEKGIVDGEHYKKSNDQFYQDYLNGNLDMDRYLEFSLAPLTQHSLTALNQWRQEFIDTRIRPLVLEEARKTVAEHRARNDFLMIITATNRFVTEPISAMFAVDHLIATDPEIRNGKYTGKVAGIPSFQEGKVTRLQQWLRNSPHSLDGSYFYSDSHNDLPLLNMVENPVAVDPDETLTRHAREKNWPIVTFQ